MKEKYTIEQKKSKVDSHENTLSLNHYKRTSENRKKFPMEDLPSKSRSKFCDAKNKQLKSEVLKTSSQVSLSPSSSSSSSSSPLRQNSNSSVLPDRKFDVLKKLKMKQNKERTRMKIKCIEEHILYSGMQQKKKKEKKEQKEIQSCGMSQDTRNYVSTTGSDVTGSQQKIRKLLHGKWPHSKDSLPSLHKSLKKSLQEQSMDFSINEECTSLDISPSGSSIVGGFTDGTMRIFNLLDRSRKLNPSNHKLDQDKDEEIEMEFSSMVDSELPLDDSPFSKSAHGAKHAIVCSRENQQYGAVAAQIHAKGVHTSLIMHVNISPDCRYAFGGVMRGSTEMVAIDMSKLEKDYENGEPFNILDSIQVWKESHAKLKGFGACTRYGDTYRLFCGRGIKNIHIWSFTPPNKEHVFPIWSCICDTQSNGNTVNFLRFRYLESGILQAISKSDGQKLRLWDMSSSDNRPPYRDIHSTEEAVGCSGAYAFSGSYNAMNVIHLDAENKLCSRMEIQLPGLSGGGRRRRGALKSIVNAIGTESGSHVLIEMSDGCILHYNKDKTASPLQVLPSNLYQPWSCSSGTSVQRKIALSRIGSDGVLVFALSQYNLTSNRGKIIFRKLHDEDGKIPNNEFWGFSDIEQDKAQKDYNKSILAPVSSVKIPREDTQVMAPFLSWSSPLSHRSVVHSSPDHDGPRDKVVSPGSDTLQRKMFESDLKSKRHGQTTNHENESKDVCKIPVIRGKNISEILDSVCEDNIEGKDAKKSKNLNVVKEEVSRKQIAMKFEKKSYRTNVGTPSKIPKKANSNVALNKKKHVVELKMQLEQNKRNNVYSKLKTKSKDSTLTAKKQKDKKNVSIEKGTKEIAMKSMDKQIALKSKKLGVKKLLIGTKSLNKPENEPNIQFSSLLLKKIKKPKKISQNPSKKKNPKQASLENTNSTCVPGEISSKVNQRKTKIEEKSVENKRKIEDLSKSEKVTSKKVSKKQFCFEQKKKLNVSDHIQDCSRKVSDKSKSKSTPSLTNIRDEIATALCELHRTPAHQPNGTMHENITKITSTLKTHFEKHGEQPAIPLSRRINMQADLQHRIPTIPSIKIQTEENPRHLPKVMLISRHDCERRDLEVQHRAAHESLRSGFLESLHRLKSETQYSPHQNHFTTDLETIVCDHEEMLENMLGRQEIEASTLVSKHRMEMGRRNVPRLQVSFPYPDLFLQVRNDFGLDDIHQN